MSSDFLSNTLQLPDNATEEETSTAIVALLQSAIHDDTPRLTLEQIFFAISDSGLAPLLDPLNTLQLLLPCQDEAAKRIMALVGKCCNAKEVLIAVQEAVERLASILSSEDDDVDNDEGQTWMQSSEGLSPKAHKPARLSPASQLINLIDLYSASIPRLTLRKKTASETLQPLFSELEFTIQYAGSRCSRNEGRQLIKTVSQLVQKVAGWVTAIPDVPYGEISTCNDILKSLIDTALTRCSHCIHSSLAQRTFENCFPRLIVRSAIEPGWEDGEKAVSDVITAYKTLGISLQRIPNSPSTSFLILLAHSAVDVIPVDHLLSAMLSILLASIQTSPALDEALSLLLRELNRAGTFNHELSTDVIIPLSAILPSLASAHPDPAIRHITFRTLSLLLSLAPSHLRLQLLKDLTSDSEFPQMRTAAIGLVKEAVLESMSPAAPRPNVFASPMFLQVFGPILLRPNPPDFFSPGPSVKDFLMSHEPSRLVECLALYYIMLQRDQNNRTGIRSSDTRANIEKSFLSPLRSCLTAWMDDLESTNGRMDEVTPLVSLKVTLERVDDAISRLGVGP